MIFSPTSNLDDTAVHGPMVHPDVTSCPLTSEHSLLTAQEKLIDEIMALKAALAGKRMELAQARGRSGLARKRMHQMYAVIRARREFRIDLAEQVGGCYFLAAADADRVAREGCL